MITQSYDVIVIGAGSVGVPAAWAMANSNPLGSSSYEKAGTASLSRVDDVAKKER
ncbi:hypothetical protein ACFLS5_01050 [Candidatus Bipolaricaulota bacterium]